MEADSSLKNGVIRKEIFDDQNFFHKIFRPLCRFNQVDREQRKHFKGQKDL